jgi:hypothetical protein
MPTKSYYSLGVPRLAVPKAEPRRFDLHDKHVKVIGRERANANKCRTVVSISSAHLNQLYQEYLGLLGYIPSSILG